MIHDVPAGTSAGYRTGRGNRAVGLTLALALLAGSQPEATLATEPPDEGLAAGPWSAAGSASGTATASDQGVNVLWRGRIPVQLQFDVSSSGSVSGSWQHQGESLMQVDGVSEGIRTNAVADLTYVGSGAVTGTNSRLELNGSTRTTGVVKMRGGGRSFQQPVDNTSVGPTLYLTVQATACDEAYGDWAYAIESALEDEGFDATIAGWWMGWRESAGVQDHAEELRRLATETGADAPAVSSESPLLDLAANTVRRYNELADGLREASLQQVFDILGDAEMVLNTLRNLSDCDVQLVGEENVAKYINVMTFIIQGLIAGGATGLEAPSREWQIMVQVAARTGAIGEGAANPELAAQAEQALIDRGSQILEEHYLPDTDHFRATEDSIRVVATGAAMGWVYQVSGGPVTARATYEKAFGTPPEQP